MLPVAMALGSVLVEIVAVYVVVWTAGLVYPSLVVAKAQFSRVLESSSDPLSGLEQDRHPPGGDSGAGLEERSDVELVGLLLLLLLLMLLLVLLLVLLLIMLPVQLLLPISEFDSLLLDALL